MIDAAVSNGSVGDTGSGNYTTHAYVTGVGKGLSVTPAKGDTGKKLLFPNACFRVDAGGGAYNYGTYGRFFSAAQHTATNAWYLVFDDNTSGYIASFIKIYANSLRCVRS